MQLKNNEDRELPQKRQWSNVDTHGAGGYHSSKWETPHGSQVAVPDSKRGRMADSRADQGRSTVLIWDVDETLVLFLSLLDGSFATAFQLQVNLAPTVHLLLERRLLATPPACILVPPNSISYVL